MVELKTAENFQLLLIAGFMVLSSVVRGLIAPPWGDVVGFLILLSPIGIIIAQAFWVQLAYVAYMIWDTLVEPNIEGRTKFYVDGWGKTIAIPATEGLNLTPIKIKPQKYRSYGIIGKFYLVHAKTLKERLNPQPRLVLVLGALFMHPNVEYPELRELDVVHTEFGTRIPVFFLERARGDVKHSSAEYILEGEAEGELTPAVKIFVDKLKESLLFYKASNAILTAEGISDKMVIAKQGNEIKGILHGNQDIMDGARKWAMDVLTRTSNIAWALKELGGVGKTPWATILTIGGAFVAFIIAFGLFALVPEFRDQMIFSLSDTRAQLLVVLVLGLIVLAIYFLTHKKRGGGWGI